MLLNKKKSLNIISGIEEGILGIKNFTANEIE